MASDTMRAETVETADERAARELADLKREIEAERAKLDVVTERGAIKVARKELARIKAETEERKLKERIEEETGEEFGKGLAYIATPGGPIVLRRSLPIVFHRFTAKKVNKETTEEFVKALVIHPAAEQRDELLDTYPGAMTEAANVGVSLYGFRGKELAGKS